MSVRMNKIVLGVAGVIVFLLVGYIAFSRKPYNHEIYEQFEGEIVEELTEANPGWSSIRVRPVKGSPESNLFWVMFSNASESNVGISITGSEEAYRFERKFEPKFVFPGGSYFD